MPDFMPYTTEKSPVFQVAETYANSTRQDALELLWALLDGDEPVSEMAPILSTSLDFPPYVSADLRTAHVEEDWWGRTRRDDGTWEDQQPYHPKNNPTTGFWDHWYGDAESVFRETMIRALSVSLGIPRETEAQTEELRGGPRPRSMSGSRHWPISVLWKCPQPWYEGWIEFKEDGPGPREGHVTVVLSTPSHGVKLYNSPIRPPGSSTVTSDPFGAYELNPTEPKGPEGLWVVSHAYNWVVPKVLAVATAPGTWAPPVLGAPVVSLGKVVCVAPAVGDGGVAPSGMAYTT